MADSGSEGQDQEKANRKASRAGVRAQLPANFHERLEYVPPLLGRKRL